MSTRKQRRRREKTFRHEYETVLLDEEGNALPVDPEELRAEREAKSKNRGKPARSGKQQPAKSRSRPLREVPQPTWRRALRRGGLMGVAMFVLFVFVLKGGSGTARAVTATLYAVAFVPLTYFADRLAYRTYLRRTGGGDQTAGTKQKR